MTKRPFLIGIIYILLLPYITIGQTTPPSCTNWLGLSAFPSNVTIGDLDVPGQQLTVEAMFNSTVSTTSQGRDIVSKHESPADANYLLRPDYASITTSTGFYTTPAICPASANKTYHVAMTYDGTTLKFYRNGFLMSQVPATGDLFQNDWATAIGEYSSGALNEQFIGYIDEVRIWNVVRTQAQIQAYMNTSLPNPATQTGLLAYYTFDDLTNKQGNTAWNGSIGGGTTINQGNPTCAAFVADSCGIIPTPLGQGCNNWLNLPATPFSSVQVGDLDVSGNQLTVEAEFTRTAPYSGGPLYAGDLVSKHEDPSNCNYLLRPNEAEITTSDGYFQTPPVCGISLNTTYQVAMTYDGSSLKFYRNGVLASQIAATGTLYQNDIPTRIGYYYAQIFNTNFVGYINEVRIWNVARTQAQIQAYMNTSLPGPTTQTGLLAYYSFNDLTNKQGNSAWNGTIVGNAAVGQTDPYCGQTGLQGTLSGSNTCNNAPGFLTFHSGSGPGPFTLTYTDGVQTYTQSNVMDGIPFAVPVQPTVATTYTLLTILDATNCQATTVPPGVTTTINPGNCTLCTGALGDPVINVTFGSGTGNAPPLETLVPGASSTNLTYQPVSGNPALPTPVDGQYSITNNVPYNNAWFAGGTDHTGNANGYMLFENPGVTPGEFFRQAVSNLCGSTKYEFAAWIANADNAAVLNAILPDLTFIVQTPDGTVLNTYNSGPVPQAFNWTWQQYGFLFTLPAGVTTVVVRIIDNNPGGNAQPGNDFAIDDITFRPCGPASSASFSNTASLTQQTVCEGGGATLYGTLSAGYTSPQYGWQISQDSGKTWADLPSSNSLQLTVVAPLTNTSIDYYYRLVAGDGTNIQSPNCRVASNDLILSVNSGLNIDFSFSQAICNPLQVQFSGPTQSGVTYTWNINGTDYPSTVPGVDTLSYVFSSYGVYPVTLTTSGTLCPGSLSKSITIRVQPADIITTSDTGICAGKTVPLKTSSILDFCWSPTTWLDNPASANPIASPPETTRYYFTAKTTGTNLIVNGNFESGNTGFTSAYTYSNSGLPSGVYVVGTSPHDWNANAPASCGDHTSGSGNMMIVNGNPVAGINVWSSGTISLTPNTNYAFSIWIQSISPNSPAILQFSINGTVLGDPVNASSATCNWNHFYTTWNSGSSTTATISLVNINTATTGNNFALDDLSFAPVSLQIDSVTINVETPLVTASPADTSICPGMPVPLHASGSLNYTWSPAAGVSDPAIADPVVLIPVTAAGTTTVYTVTGTSARGCIADTTVSITQYPRLLAIGPDTLICRGDPAPLHASGGVSYSWSPVAGLDDPASATPIARPNATTRYILTLTDPNQCIEQDSLTVSVKAVPVFHAPPDEEVCVGFGVSLKSGNAAGYIYDWSPAAGLDRPSAPEPIASPDASTRYTLHISDSLCSAYDSSFTVAVIVNPSPVISVEKDNDIDCSVHTAQLRASGASSYVWTPASGLSNAFSADPVASIDNTTTFIVKGTSLNGCYAYDSLTVLVTATGDNTFVVPNAFTPNGDGHNDCWGVTRWGDVQLGEMVIFNRWGQRVFNSRNPSDCWDGTYGGKPQPAGAYPYVIKAHSFCGVIMKTGVVMLIR
jgi:gliding motility-associated-like protein